MNATGARIVGARVAAAHDGCAELIVELRFDNGGVSEVTLDEIATSALMSACQAQSLDDLTGHGWEAVKDALTVSSNRFIDPA